MKRRITFIQGPAAPFDPHQAILSSNSFAVRNLDAAAEDRITITTDQDKLPLELRKVFDQSQELHIRWATEQPFDALAPFASRVSPGLHVHYTPRISNQSSDALCDLLRTMFGAEEGNGVDCMIPKDSFTTPPPLSAQFAASTELQYYTRLPTLQHLVAFIRNIICHDHECDAMAGSLHTADSVDIDYDRASRTLTASVFWSTPPVGGWEEDIKKPASTVDKVEVGILGAEPNVTPDEIKMGGLLGVVGEDKKLKPTMFSFPSRHHPLAESAKYSISFSQPTGLHPEMSISIPHSALDRPPAPLDATCALHTYLTLPSSVFLDQYQVSTTDPLFLKEHNLVSLRAFSGETDLEAPDWAVELWGSTWLFELATPSTTENGDPASNWTSTIPLHLRYLKPSQSGYRSAHVPWPVVFWACVSDDQSKMGLNPFDRTNLGYDGLFGPRTLFYQLHPASEQLVEELSVPVLELEDGQGLFQSRNIEIGTSIVIVLGFLWILTKLIRVVWATGFEANEVRGPDHEKKE
ncbi:Glycosylphosphatidylinositol-mannosyltransferase I PIG-X/PBN1 [Penicillium argentinense]|uniref:Protein PBN1 n=1 Tax=Penicillium argentinense TaxID=1131581 RepID=A0A9W9FGJ2_9EURO|nr:Glycosylphosphatidylinositol-mannosyltransferase I PIG-X/PBN1 [Penicillium argentinense]KAJ5099818.1 Glycosylphosphatidylinositol-mannosyltransferase I PIG-X/PBN1 [Penicillium argentinense]